MTEEGFDKRFNATGIEGHWNDSVAGEMTIDLLNVRDSASTGTIGELIAWKYLRRRKGVMSLWFGGFPHLIRFPFRKGDCDYEIRGLEKRQIEYLKTMPRSYDLIAVKRKRMPQERLSKRLKKSTWLR